MQGGRRLPIVVVVAGLFAVPALLGSCSAVNCNDPAYETFTGRLVDLHGTTATYLVESIVDGPYPASPTKVGQRRDVRYSVGDAARLRVGTSYRVELNGGGRDEPGIDSSMHRPCSVGTTFTDGSAVVTRTWWQRNRVALGVTVALAAAVFVAAVWLRRRPRARGRDRATRA